MLLYLLSTIFLLVSCGLSSLQKIQDKMEEKKRQEEEQKRQRNSDVDLSAEAYTAHELQHGIATGLWSNLMLILGVFAFAYTVKALLQNLA